MNFFKRHLKYLTKLIEKDSMKKALARRNRNKDIFDEQYEVKYNIKGSDGYWEMGCIETVFVPVRNGFNEKNNHDKAEAIFLQKHPTAKVMCVTYC